MFMCLFQEWPFCYCTFRSLFLLLPYFSSIIFRFHFDCERMNLIQMSMIFQPLFACASTLLFSFESILFAIFFQIYLVDFQWCVTILSFPIRHNIHAAWKFPYSEFFRKIQTRENSVFGHVSRRDTVSKLYVNI